MQTVKLRNGFEEQAALVTATVMMLESLLQNDAIGFYELVMLARNPKHNLWGNYKEKLTKAGILSGGQMYDSIRNIIQSAVVGEDLEMMITNPLAPSVASSPTPG